MVAVPHRLHVTAPQNYLNPTTVTKQTKRLNKVLAFKHQSHLQTVLKLTTQPKTILHSAKSARLLPSSLQHLPFGQGQRMWAPPCRSRCLDIPPTPIAQSHILQHQCNRHSTSDNAQKHINGIVEVKQDDSMQMQMSTKSYYRQAQGFRAKASAVLPAFMHNCITCYTVRCNEADQTLTLIYLPPLLCDSWQIMLK